jgi:hypothetical protein
VELEGGLYLDLLEMVGRYPKKVRPRWHAPVDTGATSKIQTSGKEATIGRRRAVDPKVPEDIITTLRDGEGKPRRHKKLNRLFICAKSVRHSAAVYNGASCGINEALWAPNVWLPTANSALRLLGFSYFSVDIDLGNFFLNFPFPEILRQYSRIDLMPFRELLEGLGCKLPRDTGGLAKVRWERCWMGCKPSPYYAVRFYYWAEDFARGFDQERLLS